METSFCIELFKLVTILNFWQLKALGTFGRKACFQKWDFGCQDPKMDTLGPSDV